MAFLNNLFPTSKTIQNKKIFLYNAMEHIYVELGNKIWSNKHIFEHSNDTLYCCFKV